MNNLGFVIACLAGRLSRHQQRVIEYLEEEVRVLKELHRGRRLRFSNEPRCRLAAQAKKLGFGWLKAIAQIVTPQTLLGWPRKLIAKQYDSGGIRKPGRPRKAVHEFVEHDHKERNHPGLENRIVKPEFDETEMKGGVACRKRLGGMLRYYPRNAASSRVIEFSDSTPSAATSCRRIVRSVEDPG